MKKKQKPKGRKKGEVKQSKTTKSKSGDSWFRDFKLKHYLFTFLFILVALELLSPIIYNMYHEESFSRSGIQKEIASFCEENLIEAKEKKEFMGIHVLHPYLGFGKNTETSKYANDYALVGPDPIVKKSDDVYNIAITGGSVANHFFGTRRAFIEELKKYPKFQNKKINVVCLALEGYKQPQQLMTLSYCMFLGAEYDMVINLDGYNDLVLSINENMVSGVNPYFPRTWNVYASKSVDPNKSVLLGEMNILKKKQIEKASLFNGFPFNQSNFLMTMWALQNRTITNDISMKNIKYLEQSSAKNTTLSFQESGPKFEKANNQEVFKDVMEKWLTASNMMSDLCKENDIEYHHFLQPNQYFSGSKKLSDQEKKYAVAGMDNQNTQSRDYFNGKLVDQIYPTMIKEATLSGARNNYPFHDITNVFKDEGATLYKDYCCHLNDTGSELLGKEIAKFIK